jgi:hypothetical protein
MYSINVEVVNLLAKLKENREKHIDEYNNTMKLYRNVAIIKLQDALTAAKSDGEFNPNVDLKKPVSYEKEYNKAIAMLEATSDATVSITDDEFDNYYLDNWSWKHSFSSSSSSYSSMASSSSNSSKSI